MKIIKRASRREKGSVLVWAVLVMLLLLINGGALLSLGLKSRTFQAQSSSNIVARCAADNGLVKAMYDIEQLILAGTFNDNNLPEVTNATVAGTNGTFSYTVMATSGNYTIKAIGTSNQAQRTVQAVVELTSPFEFSVFSKENIILRNSVTLDWYNNDSDDENMKIGTNSIVNAAVDLMNSITINGDVSVGVNGDPAQVIKEGIGITITGDTYAQATENALPSVEVPPWLKNSTSGGTITSDKTITTSGKYDEINIGNSNKIQIEGHVELYVTGNVTLGNSCEIEVSNLTPSSLTLYFGGDFEAQVSSTLNNLNQTPSNMKLYGLDTCTSVRFHNRTEFYGVIYAPTADIIMDNSADIYGSFIGKSIDFKNSVNVHYDASLRDVIKPDSLTTLKVKRWQETF